MGRPDPGLDHHGIIKCSEFKCLADQVRPEAYATHHYAYHDSTNLCAFVRADQWLSYDILKEGALPLIFFNPDTSELHFVWSDHYPRYMAISHVWAHGLGNPYDNSLPECQLRRLGKIVNELYPEEEGPVPFWVDTLSCPIEPDEARSLGIIQMRNTYRNADKVLVLDTYLDQEAEGMSAQEMLLQIICSTWTIRLWTLQEGALAKDIYFQFQDRSINLSYTQSLLHNDPTTASVDIEDMLADLLLQWHDWRPENTARLLFLLSKAVRHRSTSVAEDEALCIGTFAGIDMEEIANLEKKTPGYRWAPATLLGKSWITVPGVNRAGFLEKLDNEQTYHVADLRLVIHYPGILPGQWTSTIDNEFWIRIENDIWLHVTCSGERGFLRKDDGDCTFTSEAGFGSAEPASLAIILQDPMEPVILDALDERNTTQGLLVSTTAESGDTILACPISQVFVVSACSSLPGAEGLLVAKQIAERVEELQNDNQAGAETEYLEYGQTGSYWDYVEGAAINVTDMKYVAGKNSGRWSYIVDEKHYVFNATTLDFDQSWCVG